MGIFRPDRPNMTPKIRSMVGQASFRKPSPNLSSKSIGSNRATIEQERVKKSVGCKRYSHVDLGCVEIPPVYSGFWICLSDFNGNTVIEEAEYHILIVISPVSLIT